MKSLLPIGVLAGALSVSCCIARGARVRVPRGSRPIEALSAGDEVICIDPRTGEAVATRLSAVRSARRECVRLCANEVELTLTSDHPVYCPRSRQWAPAGDWVLGARTQLLVATADLRTIEVTSALRFCGVHDVFDLTVEHELHNFLANGILVHNKTRPPDLCSLADGGTRYERGGCTCLSGKSGLELCGPQGKGTFCQLCLYGLNGKSVDCYACDLETHDGG